MPVVPSPSVPSVAPTGNTGIGYQNANGATPDAFGAGIGTAESGFAKEVGSTGDMLAQHALKMQEDVNVSAAKDLFLAGDVEIGKLTTDYNSLEGANRVNAYPKYVEDIGAVRAKYKQAAPNDDVARRFDQDFARRVGYSIVDGARSAATANKQYQNATSTAVQKNALDHVAMAAQDDNRFDTELKIGLDAVRSGDDYKGASPEVRQQHEDAFSQGAWATRLQAMTKDDPLRARELLNKNKDALGGINTLKIEPIINQAIIQKDTKIQSDSIISEVGTGAMEDRVKKLEGYSEKPYSDFKQTSSGYGTKAQPGDENIPPEQRQAVYTQRLRNELSSAYQIVDNFAPGLPKGARDALADLTYNAGSTWTQAGLGQAIRAGDMEKAKSLLPQYNQAGGVVNEGLIARRAEELRWWNTDMGSTVDSAGVQAKALDRAKERAISVFPNDPVNQAAYLDTLQSRIVADTRIMQNSARDAQLQVKNTVMNELIDEKKNITSVDQMSSQGQAAYQSAPSGLRGIFDARMRKNASADVPPTNAGAKRAAELDGMATTRPDEFMNINIDNEPLLTRGEKKPLLAAQARREELVKRGIAVDSAMKSMHPFLTDAGIADSNADPAKRKQYEQFRGSFEAAINAEMGEKKRKLYPKEITEIGNSLLKEVVTDPGIPFVPFTGETQRAYQFEVRKGTEAADYAKIPPGFQFRHLDGTYRMKPNG